MGPIHALLTADHARLDALFRRAVEHPERVDMQAYAAFRAGLLRHIGMEEKILFPTIQRLQGGTPLPAAARLRLDHGAIAALLVPTPDPTIQRALRAILTQHNRIEEDAGGVYATCDRLASTEADALLARLQAAPAVPVAAHVDSPLVLEATRRALTRAGYSLDEFGGP